MAIPVALAALSAVTVGAVVVGIQPAGAEHHIPGSFIPTVLAPHSEFPDNINVQFRIKLDGSNPTQVINVRDPDHVVVAKIDLEPGGSVGWHTHPGPGIVTVAQGKLGIINASDCVERVYEAGQAFIDPGRGNVHVGFNASESEHTIVYATFLEVPAGSPATVPADDPGCE